MQVWTAYSRRRGQIVAHIIGQAKECAVGLYYKTLQAVGKIGHIYTDANSCYSEMFEHIGISHIHSVGKKQTHMIESTNSSIRDNLARFNRRSKRYSKRFDMLSDTLLLFFNYKKFYISIK